MGDEQLRLYRILSRTPFPKSYVGKVFLDRNLRAGDWIARWGGDEFVVGMWNTQEGQPTKRVLERVAEDLRENPVVLPNGKVAHLTFSAGTCRWRPDDDVRGLVSRADVALYRAKGGNAVVHLD